MIKRYVNLNKSQLDNLKYDLLIHLTSEHTSDSVTCPNLRNFNYCPTTASQVCEYHNKKMERYEIRRENKPSKYKLKRTNNNGTMDHCECSQCC